MKPDWLELGATVLYRLPAGAPIPQAPRGDASAEFVQAVRAKLEAGVEMAVAGIRPGTNGYELLPSRTATWLPAAHCTLVRPPPASYHPWPRGMDLGGGGNVSVPIERGELRGPTPRSPRRRPPSRRKPGSTVTTLL